MTRWRDQLADEQRLRIERRLDRRLYAVNRCARVVERAGRKLVNLSGNDYLALAGHPHLRRAATAAIEQYGVGAGASRLVTGSLDLHAQVERRFAAFKHAQAALLAPTGYMANLAALGALARPGDTICLDKLNHASLIDAARATGATVRAYPHLELTKLDRLLRRAEEDAPQARRFIVTDSVFSMDGDCAPLPDLCELRDRHEAILVVDEAHGTGVLGATGAGLAELQGVAGNIDVTISTCGKALGCLGGVVTGEQVVIEALVNTARTFIYTTAPPPMQAAAIDAALDVVRDEPQRRDRLAALSARLRAGLRERGWDVRDDPTPIVPLVVGDEGKAIALSRRLEERGYLVPAIRPPTVPKGTARLRVTLRCDLEDADVDGLIEAATLV